MTATPPRPSDAVPSDADMEEWRRQSRHFVKGANLNGPGLRFERQELLIKAVPALLDHVTRLRSENGRLERERDDWRTKYLHEVGDHSDTVTELKERGKRATTAESEAKRLLSPS